MYVEGTDAPDNLNGTDSDDTIVGKKGDDFLFGFGGDDLFTFYAGHGGGTQPIDSQSGGGDGADFVDGGSGTDTFQVNADYVSSFHGRNSDISAMVYDLHADSNGNALFTRSQSWYDYASEQGGMPQSTVTLKSVEDFSFIGTTNPAPPSDFMTHYTTGAHLTIGDLSSTSLTGQIYFSGGSDDDVLDAHAASNVILALGGTGNDTLIGGSGNDTLYGQDGNDILTAGGGLNTLVGGTGDDTYYSNNNSNTIFEQPNEGYDTLYTAAAYLLLAPNVEKLAIHR